jgi:predicted Fe-S protein YdhL (DUF1289 family)
MSQEKPVASPCIGVCFLDAGDICEGCHRTMDEIARWSAMSNSERREVVRAAGARAKERGAWL